MLLVLVVSLIGSVVLVKTTRQRLVFAVYFHAWFAQEVGTVLAHPYFGSHARLEHWGVRVTPVLFVLAAAQPRFEVVSASVKQMLVNCGFDLFMNHALGFDFAQPAGFWMPCHFLFRVGDRV